MEQVINNIEANIRALGDNVEDTRTITFIASTSSVDRHGTVLNQDNWNLKNFNNNPIIGYQHNVYGGAEAPNPDDQLGTAKAYFETVKKGDKEENQLLVDITFEPEAINPLAEKIFRKVLHGSLRAVSVGFVPLENEAGRLGENREGNFHYFGQELLEVSVVNIPSNPDALKRSLLGLIKEDVKEEIKEEKTVEEKDLDNKVKNYCNIQEKILLLKGIK